MKTKIVILIGLLVALTIACEEAGITRTKIQGTEGNLPPELKGLKIYDVSTGGGSYVKVGILNGEVNGLTYPKGKLQESLIMVQNGKNRVIEIESIISENDSIIVVKKINQVK